MGATKSESGRGILGCSRFCFPLLFGLIAYRLPGDRLHGIPAIALCRPLFRQRFPRSRARAFTWYLRDGPLVTFHRRRHPKRTWPIEVLARYHLPWDTWPKVREWDGTLDDILESLAIKCPSPDGRLTG